MTTHIGLAKISPQREIHEPHAIANSPPDLEGGSPYVGSVLEVSPDITVGHSPVNLFEPPPLRGNKKCTDSVKLQTPCLSQGLVIPGSSRAIGFV